MHPAISYQHENVLHLARRTEQQRQAAVEAALHEVIRRQPRREESQYARTDTLALGLCLLVLAGLALHILAVGGPG